MLPSASLQNPTEWPRDSPFFGSTLCEVEPLSGDADDTPGREYRYCRFLAEITMTRDVSGYGDERELALNCRVSNCRL